MSDWQTRLRKSIWARDHREQVRQINKEYRHANLNKTNAQAAERMRRLRARRKKTRAT